MRDFCSLQNTIGKVRYLVRKGIGLAQNFLRWRLEAARQMIELAAAAEDFAQFADDVQIMRSVGTIERPRGKNLPDDAVGKTNLNAGRIFALDWLCKASHRSTNGGDVRAGQMKQPVGRMITRIDQFAAALKLEIRAPGPLECAVTDHKTILRANADM